VIHPDAHRFVLGADWWLYAFDAEGKQLWKRPAPGPVWAVNISGDGRLVVAAYGDGIIRWHRMDDGRELLALQVLSDKKNWVAWTPEGFYDATPGAFGVLKWHVNRGNDAAGDAVPVSAIPRLKRPDALPLVLQELETARALGIADLAAARSDVKGGGQDLAVILFSGHGAIIDNRFYLLPYDVNARTPAEIKASAISADEFHDEVAELATYGRVLVLLDACHSGAATGTGSALTSDAEVLRRSVSASNVTVLTSSTSNEISREDDKWNHGAFTKVLLDALGWFHLDDPIDALCGHPCRGFDRRPTASGRGTTI
jgi:hypothetical protein